MNTFKTTVSGWEPATDRPRTRGLLRQLDRQDDNLMLESVAWHQSPLVRVTLVSLGLWLTAAPVSAQSYLSNNQLTIPNGNPTGVTDTINVSGLIGDMQNLQVSLNIAGGYNGSLYVTLTGPLGQKAVLLNRVGVDSNNPAGSPDPGFGIAFDDSGSNPNIHNYAAGDYNANNSGQVIGTWSSDGRDIDPQSSPDAFDSVSTAANLTQFTGLNGNGQWSLFVANLAASGSAPATLTGWSLDFALAPVPEPGTYALVGMGLISLLSRWRRRAE